MTGDDKPPFAFWKVGSVAVGIIFIASAYVSSDGALGTMVLRGLAVLGTPQYETYRELYAKDEESAGSKDYLLFYAEAGRHLAKPFFDAHPEVRVTGGTVFDNSVVVAIDDDAASLVEELRAQPFVWMLVRDRPLFFCH